MWKISKIASAHNWNIISDFVRRIEEVAGQTSFHSFSQDKLSKTETAGRRSLNRDSPGTVRMFGDRNNVC